MGMCIYSDLVSILVLMDLAHESYEIDVESMIQGVFQSLF